MVSQDLVLDRQVRDWVLIPLTCSVILMMILRQYATKLLSSGKPAAASPLNEVKEKQAVARSGVFRANLGFISESGFRQRKSYFAAKDTGLFQQKIESKNMQEQMMTNPDMMTGMMKQNLGGLVPQIAMGTFVNYFFSGFILGKVPFPLSPKFRMMLQRGIDLPSLDVTYFTSLSYYILLLFGLRGVFMLVFRDEAVDDTQMMRQQMMMGGGNPLAFDAAKAFEAERGALELTEYKSRLEGSEQRAVRILQQQLSGRGA